MKSVLDVEVSGFQSYGDIHPKSVNLLTWLTSKKFAAQIIKLREESAKAERDRLKATLPAITVSGVFAPTRKEEHLIRHSGLICIDIDRKGNEAIVNFSELKNELIKIQNVAYAGLSASGQGYFIIIPIKYPEHHKLHFEALKNDLESYGLIIDSAPQNVASLRGYSYDPGAYFSHGAIPYQKMKRSKRASEKKKLRVIRPVFEKPGTMVEKLVAGIVARRIDITVSEPEWFRLACAFANEFGEQGRGFFHQISQFYPEYDRAETDKKFDHAIRAKYHSITIATFVKLAKDALL
jgi:hypothetical protein